MADENIPEENIPEVTQEEYSQKEEQIPEEFSSENAQKQDDAVIKSITQIPDISETTPIEEQIVVVYEDANANNIEQLDLSQEDIQEGETLCDTVDVLTPQNTVDTDAFIQELENKPGVAAASRNEWLEVTALPDDPHIKNGDAWQFESVGADVTWDWNTCKETVKVAVIDSGIKANHEDLDGRYEIGYDFVQGTSSSITDITGHGTSVSGLIVATANNGKGLAGITGIAPIKVVAYRTGGTYEGDKKLQGAYIDAALAKIAARDDIQIVNMSFGSETASSTREATLKKVTDSGKILVAASGNDGDTTINYPAAYDNVISVGAIDASGNHASFSNYNNYVDLCAPGSNIYTTDIYGYAWGTGTSYSTPIVAAAAVLKSASSMLSAVQVEKILKDTAKDLGSYGWDRKFGYGLIQLDKALESIKSLSQLSITAFSTDWSSPQYAGTCISLDTNVEGGTEHYQYKYTATLNGNTSILSDYSFVSGCTWIPKKEGTYILKVYVQDSSGAEVSAEKKFVIENKEYKISLFRASNVSPQNIGQEIFLYCQESDGPAEPIYKFTVVKNGVTTIIQDYSISDVGMWKPTETGIYTLYVYLKSKEDSDDKAVSASMDFTIVNNDELKVEYFNNNRYSPQKAGTVIRLTAMGIEGAGDYQYKFTETFNGVSKTLKEYSSVRHVDWVPVYGGKYILEVSIKDASEKVVSATKEYLIETSYPDIRFTTTSISPVDIGSVVNLWCLSSGGIGELQYKFTVTYNGKETVLQDYNAIFITSWKPMKTGDYLLKVYVKDEIGTVSEYAEKFIVKLPNSLPFVDVSKTEWFYNSVAYVYHNKLMTGLNNITFGSNQPLARAQFAVILHRMNGEPKVSYTQKFPDVPAGQWFTDAVLWANYIGVVNGYENTGLFGIGDNINREQMAVMMYRYAQCQNYNTSERADLAEFLDASNVNVFAKEAMEWTVGTGIITGKYDGTRLDPQGNATRAECAAIITRFIQKYS